MSEFRDVRRDRSASIGGPIALLTGLGAAIPLTLWALGQAHPAFAVAAAVMMSVAGAVAYLRRPLTSAPATKSSEPTQSPSTSPVPPFAVILERLSDPILLVSARDRADFTARRFLFANAAARELLRIQRPEGPLTTAIRAPEVLAAVDEALFDQVTGHAFYQSGGVQDRVWRARATPLESDGENRLVLLSMRDETEFRRSERTRTDFLANASHELRTPLASLAGFIETLRGHAREDPAARDKFLAIMAVQAERMRRLIDDLMSLSRIELGEHIPPSGEVDLALAVIDVLDALGPLALERSVTFDSDLPPLGSAIIVGDRDQLLQVIQNLAENALKYTTNGSAVSVRLDVGLDAMASSAPTSPSAAHLSLLTPDHAVDRRYAVLRVADSGPGIARAHLPRLTERFYRVEGQKSGEHAGTGLGLAIVKHIINRHGGGLTVESLEGRGATFAAYVPMAHGHGGLIDLANGPEGPA
jgi:two-component system, OmpR family, phosphate regulon sensor histidine kinase PhoR